MTNSSSKFVWLVCAVLTLGSGCYSIPADDFIEDNTEYDYYQESDDGFIVDFLMEEADDIRKLEAEPEDFLAASRVMWEETDKTLDALKSVTVWVAHSSGSWDDFNELDPDGSANYRDTVGVFYSESEIDDFVIAINPLFWSGDVCALIRTGYLHELTHYVALEIDGDSDGGHVKKKYWGEGGLLALAFARVVDIRELECEYDEGD